MKGGREGVRNGMKVGHGERRDRNCCLVSKGEGKKGERENTKSDTPFPISQEEMKTCVVTREGAFILAFL